MSMYQYQSLARVCWHIGTLCNYVHGYYQTTSYPGTRVEIENKNNKPTFSIGMHSRYPGMTVSQSQTVAGASFVFFPPTHPPLGPFASHGKRRKGSSL